MDVDFMKKNYEEHSIVLTIDSSSRDAKFYPHPNNYVIPFDEPIKEVIGFEILDVAMPVTRYTIEYTNNIFCAGVFFPVAGYSVTDIYSAIENYLQFSDVFTEVFDAVASGNIFVCLNASNFSTLKKASTNINIGTNLIMLVEELTVSKTKTADHIYYIQQHDIWTTKTVGDYHYDSVRNILYSFTDHLYVSDDRALQVARTFHQSTVKFDFYIYLSCNVISEGNYDGTKLLSYMNANPVIDISRTNISPDTIHTTDWFDAVEEGDASITMKYKWSFNCEYYFFFDMNKSTIRENIGFQEINLEQPFVYKTNQRIYISSQESLQNQYLVSPGLVVLQGAKYIILRCPEIESHVLGKYSTLKQTPGIAMLKLADVNSVTNLRLDFTNIIRRNFHPIGKLSRLTFFFYDKNGMLYDFKGVEHNLLISIKYYAPKYIERPIHSTINPNYDPDILKYEMNQIKEERKKEFYLDNVLRSQRKYIGNS